ncbi:hypothetical protein OHA40_05925 [Nocardia sp. NBC_00508]|uniref:hypothetical protein n=1 Tax=Nocardia sp. NBC_00508 TaxID=2975992 RepID=UPI002E7FE500|nr:hypothetical protein [Nocardia sp. NBC_00508]WUD67667.1 hypothetical protein OHA40_05925 [Nocardia sp. NBC_00508]
MPLRSRPVAAALIYIVSSVLIGPTIYLTGVYRIRTSDRCVSHFDPEPRGADVIAAQIFQVTSAGILVAIGIFLLILLSTNHSRIGLLRLVPSSLGVLVMIFGYGITLAAGFQFPSCWR